MNLSCDHALMALAELPKGHEPDGDLAGHVAVCQACRTHWANQVLVRQVLATAPWPARSETLTQPSASQSPALAATLEADHRRHAAPARSPGPLGRGRDLALLGSVAAVILFLLARPWSDAGTAPADRSPEGPKVVATATSASPATPAGPATSTAPVPTATSPLPDWLLQADRGRIRTFIVRNQNDLLTGYDLLIDQELDFTLSPLWTLADDAVCEAIWLDWGDGQGQPLACDRPSTTLSPEQATLNRYPLKHRYSAPGAYRPQLWMRQQGGELLTGPAADFVVLDRHVSEGAPADRGPFDQGVVADDPLLKAQLIVLLGLWALLLWWWVAPRSAPAWLMRLPGWLLFFLLVATLLSLPLRQAAAIPRHQIEPLVGRVGLDPLRPDAALVRVERQFSLGSLVRGRGRLRLLFADGGSSIAEPPVLVARWRTLQTEYGEIVPRHEDALGRLRTVHAPLHIPFADIRLDGLAVAMPVALPSYPSAKAALEFREAWYRSACSSEGNLIVSPDERSALIARPEYGALTVFLVDLASGFLLTHSPARLRDVAWSPDSRWVLGRDYGSASTILSLRDSQRMQVRTTVDLELESGYGVNGDGIWLALTDGAWRVDWPTSASQGSSAPGVSSEEHEGLRQILSPRPAFAWPAEPGYQAPAAGRWIAPAPDGRTIAYACEGGLCLVDRDGRPVAVVRSDYDQAARHAIWHPNGRRLALLEVPAPIKDGAWPGSPWSGVGRGIGSATLSIIDDRGQQIVKAFVGSTSTASPPRWTRDGRWLIFTSCPQDGRRIIAVDAERGAAVDLSQPGWDAWAVLMPQSGDLLLHNGRGGLWRAALVLGGEGP